jgi:hypothetical protein
VRDLLLARFKWIREQSNTMLSINILRFIMPRDAHSGDTEPVIVILHGSHVLQQSTIEALINGTVGYPATCTPIHFGPSTIYAAVTLHPIYSAFLRMISKLMWSYVDRNFYQRFDFEGTGDEKRETMSKLAFLFEKISPGESLHACTIRFYSLHLI